MSNSQLDIIEENALTTHLTFGRKNGLMLSGVLIGSIVFDVGIFASENTLYRGLEDTTVARLMWNRGNLHLEWAFANQEGKDISSTVHSTRDTSTMAFGASPMIKKDGDSKGSTSKEVMSVYMTQFRPLLMILLT